MNARKYIRNALLVLVFGSILYMAATEIADRRQAKSGSQAAESSTTDTGDVTKVVVYYFSEGKECSTCENIESYTREALETYFSHELSSGVIAWRSIDVDERRHEHFIPEYNLYTKSVVLVQCEHGRQVRWKNLEAVWDLVYDKPSFMEYIRDQTREYLDAAS